MSGQENEVARVVTAVVTNIIDKCNAMGGAYPATIQCNVNLRRGVVHARATIQVYEHAEIGY